MRPSVYLAGPISGCSYEGATNWREEAASVLFDEGIAAFSPMRHKEYLLGEHAIQDSYDQHYLSTMRAIMTRDFRDATKCDMIITNVVGATKVSIGTVMEIAWGFQARVPVVLVSEGKENPHYHGMIREAIGWEVKTMQEAILIARTTLLP
jgi:nucleoside 2-deoxyribosyltransferase